MIDQQEPADAGGLPTLYASFRATPLQPVLDELDLPADQPPREPPWIKLQLRKPTEAEELADEAKVMEEQGLLIKQIAKTLGERHGRKISKGTAGRALDHWYGSRGQERPDGRARRAGLGDKAAYADVANEPEVVGAVIKRYHDDELLGDIATHVGLDRNTITKIIRQWHEARGLATPDGRTRRKKLDKKQRP